MLAADAFAIRRLGVIMTPSGDLRERAGVLNPAVARSEGHPYLFPRLVEPRNYSRIGMARVIFDADGDPAGVERLGVVLEPQEPFEHNRVTGGGCEDPRITFISHIGYYVMTYTAFGERGPRVAFAASRDLNHWERLGLARFSRDEGIDFTNTNNKDAVLFPEPVLDPRGRPSLAMLHRPLFEGTDVHETMCQACPRRLDLRRESMWISYAPIDRIHYGLHELCHFTSHHRLASPVSAWERLKIGAGTPPIQTRHGYMLLYHGVSLNEEQEPVYSAGILVLDIQDPRRIRYRSLAPVLVPQTPDERVGTVPRVVFPTGADYRRDIASEERIDVYYGMADYRIGAAALRMPEILPAGAPADIEGGCI